MRHVPGEGPLDAAICMIGEAPGRQENATGRPFMGASGNLAKEWWRQAGVYREQIRIENLLEYMPRGAIESVDLQTLVRGVYDLRQRITQLKYPCVLVPTGNYATFALTGRGKVRQDLRNAIGEEVSASEAEKKAGITNLRGSIYRYYDLIGREMKVIPTIHPSYFLRGKLGAQGRAFADWKRIVKEAKRGPIVIEKPRYFLTQPTEFEIDKFTQFTLRNQERLRIAIDIETWGRTLSCVGFALSDTYAIVIPTSNSEQRGRHLPYIKQICECGAEKILQNGLYDTYWLRFYGVEVNNWLWDTLAMAHALNSVGEFSLNYLCSIHVDDYRYWKDEAKDAEEIIKYATNLESLWTYNALDCTYTWELFWHLLSALLRDGKLPFYRTHYARMFGVLLDLMRGGVAVDTKAQRSRSKELLSRCADLRDELKRIAGYDLYAKKDFSVAKLRKYFYEDLKLPKQTKWTKVKEGKKRTVTLDKTALNKIIQYAMNPKKKRIYGGAQKPAELLLKHRKKKKLADFMKGVWDKDERIRCSYKFTTEAGRLSSAKNPMGKGYNLQNPDRQVRDTFLPDEGCVFLKIDLSQVEDRMIKMYTRQPRMVELARTKPWEFDAHTYNACKIFKIEENKVHEKGPTGFSYRDLGKKAVHGAQRAMRGGKLSNNLLNDYDIVVMPEECQRMIDAYLEDHWELRDHYFPWVKRELWDKRKLTNSWGRTIHFEFDEFDDDLYRKGYSFYGQSECADLENQYGLVFTGDYLKRTRKRSKVNLQVHDELVISAFPDEVWDIARRVCWSLERPRVIAGNELSVPAELCIADSWADKRFEFKKFPQADELMDTVNEVLKSVWWNQ